MFGRRKPVTLGLLGLQQLLGVGGALTLASMLKELVTWVELLKAIFAGWAGFVSAYLWPVVTLLFGWILELIKIEMTPFWKDYLTIGLLFSMGFARHFVIVMRRIKEEGSADLEKWGNEVVIPFPIYMSFTLKWAPIVFAVLSSVAWPLTLLIFMLLMLTSREDSRFVAYGIVSIFLPLIYLCLLIAFNEIMLR